MTFFNKKEEVLDIKLTQFGKQLLSMGRFKPTYYAFFDDNILYDGAAGGILEVQNDIEGRIQEETPQNKTQHVFSSIENNFSRYLNQVEAASISEIDKLRVQPTPEKEFSLVSPLGHSDFETTSAPSWRITFLESNLKSSSYFLTGSYQTLQIPQLDIDVVYTTEIMNPENAIIEPLADVIPGDSGPPGQDSTIFSDGSVISVNIKGGEGDLLLMVEENGVNFDKKNFEIEVIYVEPADNSYTPLSFIEQKSNVVNGLLVSETIPETPTPVINESYVEFFFDLFLDHKINERQLCESINRIKSKGIYVDSPMECKDIVSLPLSISPYGVIDDPSCKDE